MAITAPEARARLERMVAASSVPTLDAGEVDDLMLLAARNDSLNVVPGQTGWAPTYALNDAAAEGWRWKAGKVVSDVTIGQDGSTINRSDMHKHCLSMASYYDARLGQTVGDVVQAAKYRSFTIGLDAPTGPSVGYGPMAVQEVTGRVTDYGPPTLVQGNE